jgi:hypothetical protein
LFVHARFHCLSRQPGVRTKRPLLKKRANHFPWSALSSKCRPADRR